MVTSTQQQDEDLAVTHVKLGRIGAPWGVKGWVKLISFTDPLDNLLDYQQFVASACRLNLAGNTIAIEEGRPQGKGLVGHIKGCDSPELASQYTGTELWIAKAELPELSQEYYWYQLEHLRVVNLEGLELGSVHHLMETGANDVLVLRADGVERLLPYVPQVIKKVDLDAGLIEVDWLPEWD